MRAWCCVPCRSGFIPRTCWRWWDFPPPAFGARIISPCCPGFFLYCAGYFLWGLVDQSDRAKQLLKPGLRPLSFLGRHSLLIYLIHQPALMAVFTAAGWIWS